MLLGSVLVLQLHVAASNVTSGGDEKVCLSLLLLVNVGRLSTGEFSCRIGGSLEVQRRPSTRILPRRQERTDRIGNDGCSDGACGILSVMSYNE